MILILKMHHILERRIEVDKDEIKVLIKANCRITTREIATELNLSNSFIYDHMKRLYFVSKPDI